MKTDNDNLMPKKNIKCTYQTIFISTFQTLTRSGIYFLPVKSMEKKNGFVINHTNSTVTIPFVYTVHNNMYRSFTVNIS